MNIELKDKNGITLKTAGKYCSSDVGIIPKLQSKSVATNGSVVADEGYCGLDSVTVDVPATPTQEKTVDLAMALGDQVIPPDSGYDLSKVTVKKPSTLVASNIKTGVSIGGVTGTLEPQTAPTLQTKTVTPTKSQQNIAADSGYDGLSGVTVNAIPDNYVIPTGTVNITANGTHDVSGKASVVVAVPSSQPTLNAPTIAINDKTLTITNPASNGNFVTKFKVFSNGTALTEAVIKGSTTTVDLSTLLTTAGTYSITAKASAANFNDSAASNAVSYEVVAAGYNVTVTAGQYDFDIYDGQSASGTYLGNTYYSGGSITVVCTSGYLYFSTNDPGDITSVTGGVTIVDSYTVRVTGDGTVTASYSCLIEGTQITLADGTSKAIEDITYDDELLVWNFYDGKFDKAKPSWIKVEQTAPRYNLVKFSNGSEVGFVGPGGDIGYHRVFNKEAKAFTHTGVADTPNGTTTFAQDGTSPTVVSQEVVEKEVKFYNVITDKHYNIFANGILTSCRLSNKYRIDDMRYIGEKLISDEQEKAYFERIESKRK